MDSLPLNTNKTLSAKAKAIEEGVALGNIRHQNRNAAFRVVVYRVNYDVLGKEGKKGYFSGKINDKEVKYDDIFNIDPISDGYMEQVEWFSKEPEKRINELISSYYSDLMQCISDGLDSDGSTINSLYNTNGTKSLVQAIDITPLVTSVTTTNNLDSPNGCRVNMINPTLAAFNLPQLLASYNFNQWMHYMSVVDPSAQTMAALEKLKSFKFKEYDFVRVYMYNGKIPLKQAMDSALSNAGATLLSSDKGKFICSSIMPVAFTGVAVSVTDQNSVNEVANISVECHGMMRLLANTSTVVDQSLCNQIVMQHGTTGSNLSMLSKPIKIWSNFYTDKHSMDCFVKIMEEYFKPAKVVDTSGTTPHVIGGAPSIFNLADEMYRKTDTNGNKINRFTSVADIEAIWPKSKAVTVDVIVDPLEQQRQEYVSNAKIYSTSVDKNKSTIKGKPPTPSFVQLLNTLLCYHVVKTRAGELIYFIDDAIDPFPEQGKDGVVLIDRSVNTLRPYLLMTKTGFQVFDASYQSPYSVMETIRSQTYLEVFEDRQGTFHIRFPRYNYIMVDHELPFENMISVGINRTDSGNMNVVQAKFMMDFVGALNAVPSRVYVDPISVFKYGTRVTENIENPNCITPEAAVEMAKFLRYYHLGLQSRTATLNCIGDPYVSQGHTIAFRLGYAGNQNDGVSNAGKVSLGVAGGASATYMGYVGNVEDTISVDGAFTQKITAKFVREASISNMSPGSIPVSKQSIPGHARFSLAASEAMLNYRWAPKESAGTVFEEYGVASRSRSASDLKSVGAWCHQYVPSFPRRGSFQRFYSVQDLAGLMAIGLAIAEKRIGGSSDNGQIGSVSIEEMQKQLMPMFLDASKAWVEDRAQLMAVEQMRLIVFTSAQAFASPSSINEFIKKSIINLVTGVKAPSVPVHTYANLLAAMKKIAADCKTEGEKALKVAKSQGITPDMAPSGSVAGVESKGYVKGSIFSIGDFSEQLPWNGEVPKFHSSLDTVDFKSFLSNITVKESDIKSFYDTPYVSMGVGEIIELIEAELTVKSARVSVPTPTDVVEINNYAKVLSEVYTAIAGALSGIEKIMRDNLKKKYAGGMNMIRLGNTIIRLKKV